MQQVPHEDPQILGARVD